MADIQKELRDYNRLGHARQLAASPKMTPERGRELGSKYAKQSLVRAEKFDRVAKTVLGT
jgi:hypothetical protein